MSTQALTLVIRYEQLGGKPGLHKQVLDLVGVPEYTEVGMTITLSKEDLYKSDVRTKLNALLDTLYPSLRLVNVTSDVVQPRPGCTGIVTPVKPEVKIEDEPVTAPVRREPVRVTVEVPKEGPKVYKTKVVRVDGKDYTVTDLDTTIISSNELSRLRKELDEKFDALNKKYNKDGFTFLLLSAIETLNEGEIRYQKAVDFIASRAESNSHNLVQMFMDLVTGFLCGSTILGPGKLSGHVLYLLSLSNFSTLQYVLPLLGLNPHEQDNQKLMKQITSVVTIFGSTAGHFVKSVLEKQMEQASVGPDTVKLAEMMKIATDKLL